MLLHGDEAGRTQDGNNNTYAQDSEISWMHWDDLDQPLVEFTASVSRLRRDHPTFRRKRFFTGTSVRTGSGEGERLNDIVWLHPAGHPFEDDDWTAPDGRSIGMYLNGHGIPGLDARGGEIVDDHFLLYFNAAAEDVMVTLPPEEYAAAWDVEIDTAGSDRTHEPLHAGSTAILAGRSLVVLREHSLETVAQDSSVAASVAASRASRADRTR
jgi:glycogen operon protein